MKDVLIDNTGALRCPQCGGSHFDRERTATAKVAGYTTLGVGVFLTKKRMRCLVCGEWSKSGNARPAPYDHADAAAPTLPAAASTSNAATSVESVQRPDQVGTSTHDNATGTQLRQLAALHSSGVLTDQEFAEAKQRVINEI